MAGLVLHNAPTIGPGPWSPSKVLGTSTTVFANGKQIVVRQDDRVQTHTKPGDDPQPISGKVIARTSKVFVQGKPLAQIGDVCDLGEVIIKSSSNVFAS
ncbi:phospholipase [Aeromonas phage Ahp1_CNU-2021]|nr:phospholipase [Aeromonas phage Ahp1_CNU-2021]